MKYLLYVTKAKPYLFSKRTRDLAFWQEKDIDVEDTLNGHIVAEFDGECEEMFTDENGMSYYTDTIKEDYMVSKLACLDDSDIYDYLGNNIGYAIHIVNLHVFDKPLELNELYRKYDRHDYSPVYYMPITTAPQNMCYVWYKGEKYCLISIRPEWACKILNGEKTIEVRKKVLKECL